MVPEFPDSENNPHCFLAARGKKSILSKDPFCCISPCPCSKLRVTELLRMDEILYHLRSPTYYNSQVITDEAWCTISAIHNILLYVPSWCALNPQPLNKTLNHHDSFQALQRRPCWLQQVPTSVHHLSYNLKSLRGDYITDYVGDYWV